LAKLRDNKIIVRRDWKRDSDKIKGAFAIARDLAEKVAAVRKKSWFQLLCAAYRTTKTHIRDPAKSRRSTLSGEYWPFCTSASGGITRFVQ